MAVGRTLLLALALCAFARPVHAGCGGSGGSSGDSGGSDDSDDSDSCPMDWGTDDDDGDPSYDGPPARPVCVEVSDTVGESACRRFGDRWDTSSAVSVRLSIRPAFRLLRLDGVSFAGRTEHLGNAYQTGDGTHGLHDASLVVGGASARLDIGFLDYFSAGIEVALLGAEARGPTRRDGAVAVTPDRLVTPSIGLLAGGAIPVDIVTFRPELYVGYRVLSLQSRTQVGDCIDFGHATVGQVVLEPRITAEVFVTPYVSLAGTVGSNVLSGGEVHGTLSLGLHARAFDGQPR